MRPEEVIPPLSTKVLHEDTDRHEVPNRKNLYK